MVVNNMLLIISHRLDFLHVCNIYVTGAVSTRIPDLMGQHRTTGLSSKINHEVRIKLHSPINSVNINDEHHGALVAHLWVELLVPGGEEGGGHIQPLAIQAELQHLRCSF